MQSDSVIASHSSIAHIILKLEQENWLQEVFDLSQKPVFVFANHAAAKLWGLRLEEFIGMDSSKTAEAQEQTGRNELLQIVEERGFIDNYSGIRVDSQGRRFYIEDACVWQVFASSPSQKIGQAVKFERWHYID